MSRTAQGGRNNRSSACSKHGGTVLIDKQEQERGVGHLGCSDDGAQNTRNGESEAGGRTATVVSSSAAEHVKK